MGKQISRFSFLAYLFLGWLLFFAIQRAVFLFAHFNYSTEGGLDAVLACYKKGLVLDISSACYHVLVCWVVLLAGIFIPNRFIEKLLRWITGILVFLSSMIVLADVGLFSSWKTKLNYKALTYLENPTDFLMFVNTNLILQFTIGVFVLCLIGLAIFYPILKRNIIPSSKKIRDVFLMIFSAGILFVGLRGGIQEVPINQSFVFFSNKSVLNYAALNSNWNVMNSIFENQDNLGKNPYIYFKTSEADSVVHALYTIEKDSTEQIFNLDSNQKPNIIFVTIEGFNANVLKHHNKRVSFAPFLDSIIPYGFYFDKFYSTAFRTDQGIAAYISGFPSQPLTTITTQPEKFNGLPSLFMELKKQGYFTKFVFGGESEFANMKAFLLHEGVDKIIDMYDFPKEKRIQKLGVPDGDVFEKALDEMKQSKEPFFMHIMTQTTHEPYDMDFNNGIHDERLRYLNTVKYLDACLKKFTEKLNEKAGMKNTILIISADHAHHHPKGYNSYEVERQHIPLLIYSPLLKSQYIKQDSVIFSQTDFPLTLLKQLNSSAQYNFPWSKNRFNTTYNPFAFYTFVNGFGYIDASGSYAYDAYFKGYRNVYIKDTTQYKSHILKGHSYMQSIMETYLKM